MSERIPGSDPYWHYRRTPVEPSGGPMSHHDYQITGNATATCQCGREVLLALDGPEVTCECGRKFSWQTPDDLSMQRLKRDSRG